MGEAIYYGKLKYKNEVTATIALPIVEGLLKEIRQAEDEWQELRGTPNAYTKLKEKYFKVFDLLNLGTPSPDDAQLNYLAGELDSPYDESDWQIQTDGDCILFSGEVWHFANWDNMMAGLARSTGAIGHGWISDEYIRDSDYYNMIGLEE